MPRSRDYSKEIEYYKNNFVSLKDCAEKFHLDIKTFVKKLKEQNIEIRETRRKYKIDEEYFKNINNGEKIYWLGFLMADGYLNSKGTQFGITLSESDENHIEKFKECLKSDHPIKHGINNHSEFSQTKVSVFRISSKKLYNDLINLGFTSNKTGNEFFIHSDYDLDFIRGMFDGDGWLNYNKKHHSREFGICSNLQMCESIKKVFEKNGVLHADISKNNTKKSNELYRIRYYRKKELLKIYDLLYNRSSKLPYLNRKKEKFNEIINDFN